MKKNLKYITNFYSTGTTQIKHMYIRNKKIFITKKPLNIYIEMYHH